MVAKGVVAKGVVAKGVVYRSAGQRPGNGHPAKGRSPERAAYRSNVADRMRPELGRPYRAPGGVVASTQGVALGCDGASLWDSRSALKRVMRRELLTRRTRLI